MTPFSGLAGQYSYDKVGYAFIYVGRDPVHCDKAGYEKEVELEDSCLIPISEES